MLHFDILAAAAAAGSPLQLVLISAGFDAADGDSMGCCRVSPAGFAAMTQRLMRHAGGKCVAVLEGGYVPRWVAEFQNQ
jgi:histone deacetylase 6